MAARKRTTIDKRWRPSPMTQAEVDAEKERRARKKLRLVSIADVKELHWWREHFATRFTDGSLPRPRAALDGRRFALFEITEDGALLALGQGTNTRIESASEAVRRARQDSQRSLQLAAQARRQITSAADFCEMLMGRLAEIAEQLPAHDQVGDQEVKG